MGSVRKELRRELRRYGVIEGLPTSPALTFVWRYSTGAHLDGERRTDAGWIRPGRYALTDYRIGRWYYWPRLARAAVRWVVPPVLVTPAASALRWEHLPHTVPHPVFDTAAALAEYEGLGLAAGGAVLGWLGWRVADAALHYRHDREWLQPVHEGLAEVFDLPGGTRPRSYLRIVPNYQTTAGPIVRVNLPKGFLGEPGKTGLVEHVLRTRLDLYDPRFEWSLMGRNRTLTVWHEARDVSTQTFPTEAVDGRLRPLWEAVAPLAGLPIHDEPRKWLAITGPIDTPNPNDAKDAQVRLELPSAWAGQGKADIKRAIEEKLDVDLGAAWHAKGGTPYVILKRAPEPPRLVTLADIRDELETLPAGVVGLGKGVSNTLIKHNHVAEAPHIFHSGGTGAGKSTFLGLHVAQEYRKGADHIVVCDGKFGDSLPRMMGIEGITIFTEPSGMWRGIDWVHEQMVQRLKMPVEEYKASGMKPIYLVLEEAGMYGDIFGDYWDEVAPKGARRKPPIFKKIRGVAFQGRSREVYLVGSAQYFAAEIFGNNVLAQFGGRGYCRFNAEAWNRTMRGVPRPRSATHPGRGIWAVQDSYEAIQFAFGTPDELRSFALERTAPVTNLGPNAVASTGVAGDSYTFSPGDLDEDDDEYPGTAYAGDAEPRPRLYAVPWPGESEEDESEVQDEVLVTLGQAVDMELISISKNTAQKYAKPSDRKYDPTFPKPAGRQGQAFLYRARELEEWEAMRKTTGTGETG